MAGHLFLNYLCTQLKNRLQHIIIIMAQRSSDKNELLQLIREHKPLSFKQQLWLTIQLSLPAILASASAMVMQFIDAAMVGRLGADDSASVGLMGTTFWLFEGIASSFVAGYAVQVAHLLGGKRAADARQVVRQSLVVCSLFGLGWLNHFDSGRFATRSNVTVSRPPPKRRQGSMLVTSYSWNDFRW